MQSPKRRMISVCVQDKSFNITVIQAYAPTSNAEEAEVEWLYEDLQDLFRTVVFSEYILVVQYEKAKRQDTER